MIGFLRGQLLHSTPDTVVLDVQGVGYEVHVPLSTFYEIEKVATGEAVRLFIHTHVREDELALFGFWSERERALFRRLISVGGIGPKLARVILSGMQPNDLIAAIASEDVARLTRTPGVGKKTAERMVLELKDGMRTLADQLPEQKLPSSEDDDVTEALMSLGYKISVASRAVVAAREELPEAAFAELLRAALSRLSRA